MVFLGKNSVFVHGWINYSMSTKCLEKTISIFNENIIIWDTHCDPFRVNIDTFKSFVWHIKWKVSIQLSVSNWNSFHSIAMLIAQPFQKDFKKCWIVFDLALACAELQILLFKQKTKTGHFENNSFFKIEFQCNKKQKVYILHHNCEKKQIGQKCRTILLHDVWL